MALYWIDEGFRNNNSGELEMSQIKHGHTRRTATGRVNSPEWRAYQAMRTRCTNPNQLRFKDYGGRGIKVCDRWLFGEDGRSGFECFLADVGPKPDPTFTLDREKNDRGYEPGNVRWATRIQQARNTRASVRIDVCGTLICLAEAIERWAAVSDAAVRMRLHRGWSFEDALFVPLRGKPGDADAPVCF